MAKKEGELTPMMKQFYDLKAKHPDALLLFRCGDFYETYCDDAVAAAKILGITLTKRNNGASQGDAMAGFPHHALDTYLPRLIRAGRRVAICDQLEDPKLTKKLVKRGITELVTPGVAMQDNVLDYKQNNFLCAIHFGKNAYGLSLLDISTGEFLIDEGTCDYIEKMLANFKPKEILIERGRRRMFEDVFGLGQCMYEMDDWVFTDATAKQRLNTHFKVKNMKGYGVDNLKNGMVAAGAILQYLEITQHTHVSHITRIRRIDAERFVRMDNFTIRNLEILDSISNEGANLVDVIDRTVSPMGARLIRRWVVFPLREEKKINERLDVVDYFFRDPEFRDTIDEHMQQIGDIERISSKIAVGRVTPRELIQLKIALTSLSPIKQACLEAGEGRGENGAAVINALGNKLDPLEELRDLIDRYIQPDPPQLVNKGNVIREGVNTELDELRHIAYSGKDYLIQMQQKEAERTGITSLKIGYNNVFGYYLEVRNTFKDNVPPEWIRKQTLAQAERYITQELKEYEEKILGAEDKILALETRIYTDLVQGIARFIETLQLDAKLIGQMDCLLSFAKTAVEHHYVRPVVDNTSVLDIKKGRHPVIETNLPVGEQYIPNDVLTEGYSGGQSKKDSQPREGRGGGAPQIMIITGPNMAGKSALLRQTALIVLMAQIGCYVPAESARIGIVDKIFTRVGASDNLSQGESTFMVEMTEAANILNNVSDHSLVLFDELGRGTSTYDGISIAWAIVEYLHEHSGVGARTLFATHYHELNEMEKHFPRIRNYNVSVKEMNGKIIFLRKLMEGGTEHSFGIHVAQLAGMPQSIIKRANVILKALEEEGNSVGSAGKPQMENVAAKAQAQSQLSFFQLDDPVLCQVRDEIMGLDIDNLTPMQALMKLNEIKKIVGG